MKIKLAHIALQVGLLCLCILFMSCASEVRFAQKKYNRSDQTTESAIYLGKKITGQCSFYGPEFEGRKTSNGEIYDAKKMTAAHTSLPFGTVLLVENPENGKKVRVRINDRGPFKKGRVLDLSYAAAQELGILSKGTAQISATIVEIGKGK